MCCICQLTHALSFLATFIGRTPKETPILSGLDVLSQSILVHSSLLGSGSKLAKLLFYDVFYHFYLRRANRNIRVEPVFPWSQASLSSIPPELFWARFNQKFWDFSRKSTNCGDFRNHLCTLFVRQISDPKMKNL